jgi:membrane protein insertase Oxa1/YidC/SpoIIIJ
MNKFVLLESVLVKKGVVQASSAFRHPGFIQITYNPHQLQRRQFSQSFWASVSASAPVTYLQDLTLQLHDSTGLPWWGTIVVSTILLRGIFTFPLAIFQAKILAKVENITTEMPAIVKELKIETARAIKKFEWSEAQARVMYNRSLGQQWNNLIVRDNCHPAKSTVVLLFQIPLWITQSWAIRNLIYVQPDPSSITAQIAAAGMMTEGKKNLWKEFLKNTFNKKIHEYIYDNFFKFQ